MAAMGIAGARGDQGETRWSGRAIWSVGLLLLLLIMDGIDIQLLSLLSPLILAEWGIGRAAFGIPMSAALVGMAIGASVGGWLGDRYGRRTVLTWSAIMFGVATVLAGFCDGAGQLAVLRLIGGLGFGAAGPTAIALAAGCAPTRARNGVAGGFSIATPLGGLIGAAATLALAPLLDWRGCFILCGLLSIGLGIAIRFAVPEKAADVPGGAAEAGRASPAAAPILSHANRRFNAAIWSIFFLVQFVAYAFVSWAPAYLTGAGTSLTTALTATSAFNLLALGSAAFVGPMLLRWGSRPLLAIGCGAAVGGAVLLLGAMHTIGGGGNPGYMLPAAGALLGGGTGLVIGTLYALCVHGYPAERRAGGLGVGLMLGRLGGVTAALGGGALISSAALGNSLFSVVLAAAGVGSLLLIPAIDRHVKKRIS
jgi:AAHS family 4-hydroxybenzoate transporter-like MFS transporter